MKTLLEVGMLASLVMAVAAPAIMPTVVFAQTDVRQEDRRADRGGRGRYGLCTDKRRQNVHPDAVLLFVTAAGY